MLTDRDLCASRDACINQPADIGRSPDKCSGETSVLQRSTADSSSPGHFGPVRVYRLGNPGENAQQRSTNGARSLNGSDGASRNGNRANAARGAGATNPIALMNVTRSESTVCISSSTRMRRTTRASCDNRMWAQSQSSSDIDAEFRSSDCAGNRCSCRALAALPAQQASCSCS